jgi:hypothetical protein
MQGHIILFVSIRDIDSQASPIFQYDNDQSDRACSLNLFHRSLLFGQYLLQTTIYCADHSFLPIPTRDKRQFHLWPPTAPPTSFPIAPMAMDLTDPELFTGFAQSTTPIQTAVARTALTDKVSELPPSAIGWSFRSSNSS